MPRSNQLSYEGTADTGSWSFVSSNVPVMNESMDEMIYEMIHVLNCGYEIKWSYDYSSQDPSTTQTPVTDFLTACWLDC